MSQSNLNRSDTRQDAASAAAHIGPATKILVAEDHPINQKVFGALLALVGAVPTLVDNGAQAVLAWELGAWDIILMDIQMPELDGVSAARLIRAREAESGRPRTPILAVTCNTSEEDAARYRAAGIDALVPKPIEYADLMTAMDQALAAAPARGAAKPYRPLRVQPHAVTDAPMLTAYITQEMKRLGLAQARGRP